MGKICHRSTKKKAVTGYGKGMTLAHFADSWPTPGWHIEQGQQRPNNLTHVFHPKL